MNIPEIQEKVAFLSRPESYAVSTPDVEVIQTHMSWVFLTDTHAWKLKKPVQFNFLNFASPEARKRNCEEEVRLNRRLAPDVYFGVVPLSINARGNLTFEDGQSQHVDWLVMMRRLPSGQMLDKAIENQTWTEADIARLGEVLVEFYTHSAPLVVSPVDYRDRLQADLVRADNELSSCEDTIPLDLLAPVIEAAQDCLQRRAMEFDGRVRRGKILEAHGDLRAEHICLENRPVVIDCLEFNRSLRLLDPISELTFFALECERLGAPDVGRRVMQSYCEVTKDRPAAAVLDFYRWYHCCIRAQIAAWHLREPNVETPARWTQKAAQYLQLAAGF